MTVHFFTKGNKNAGSSRQRAFFVAEKLNQRGIHTIVHKPPLIFVSQTLWPQKKRLIIDFLKIFTHIKKDDVIYLQRAIYNKYFFILIVLYKIFFDRKIIFDFDDAIYLHSFLKTKTLVRLADVVIVGSHTLAIWAYKYNKKVEIIPTSVCFSQYERFTKNYTTENKVITIGWIGGAKDQFENLKILKAPLQKLVSKGLLVKFVLIGAQKFMPVYNLFSDIKGLETSIIDTLRWDNPNAVPSYIQQFDIGVMPLTDDEWNRGKCAFKAIEYMACGVATICSAVGENNYLIQDGNNGLLVANTEEWFNKLRLLILNSDLRQKLGKNGQQSIKERYSYDVSIPRIINILNKI